jgi:hypothetical protein
MGPSMNVSAILEKMSLFASMKAELPLHGLPWGRPISSQMPLHREI